MWGCHIECVMTVRDLVFGTSGKRWLSLSQCLGRFWERRRHLMLLCASCLSSTAYGTLLCPQTFPSDVLTLSLYVWTSPRVFVAGFLISFMSGIKLAPHRDFITAPCQSDVWFSFRAVFHCSALNYVYLSVASQASSFSLVSLAFAVSSLYKWVNQ